MVRFIYTLISIITLSLTASYASEDHKPTEKHEEKFDASSMIRHHIGDSHEWHLFDFGGDSYTIPLPIILINNGSLDIFLSSKFIGSHHGAKTYKDYILDHEKITTTSKNTIYDFSITKNVASMFVAVILMFIVIFAVKTGYKSNRGKAPKGIQSFFEPVIVYIRDEVAIPNLGHNYSKYMPFLLTIFFFILFNNMLGLIPTGANASGNVYFTIILALITAVIVNFSGKSTYWKHIFMPPGVPLWLYPMIVPIEMLGIFTKPFALTIRLFANITAGHIIILSLFSFIFVFNSFAVAVPVAIFATLMTFMELFVAFLQAFIFTMLAALFIGTAVEEHHEDHH